MAAKRIVAHIVTPGLARAGVFHGSIPQPKSGISAASFCAILAARPPIY
jgi:hypothetical protein